MFSLVILVLFLFVFRFCFLVFALVRGRKQARRPLGGKAGARELQPVELRVDAGAVVGDEAHGNEQTSHRRCMRAGARRSSATVVASCLL